MRKGKGKVEIELNLRGLNQLMKSPEIQAQLQKAGDAVAAAAGKGYGTRVHDANFVSIANVYPDTKEAAHDNYKNNSLLKAIGSVGLKTRK